MINKLQAGYQHAPNTQYQCEDCVSYMALENRCYMMGPQDLVLAMDTCSYFAKGPQLAIIYPDLIPSKALTKVEAGWGRNPQGFSCKRCEHWSEDGWDCNEVLKDGPEGCDDPGMIHPDACCNVWEPDPVRSQMPTEGFYEVTK